MRFRKLRIAWSVLSASACVLLMVLWVRSYWYCDTIEGSGPSPAMFDFATVNGNAVFLGVPDFQSVFSVSTWSVVSESIVGVQVEFPAIWLPRYTCLPNMMSELQVPCWMVVLLIGGLCIAPWIRRSTRFSLRTLLIATTLVAMVLGLIVYAASK
jgi:hypothetical protein